MAKKTKNTIHTCTKCKKDFKNKGGLTQHMKTHAKKKTQRKPKKLDTPVPAEINTKALMSDVTGMKNPGGYVTLILFCALPRVYRKGTVMAKTQEELAEILEVNVATLSEWKTKTGFWDDVKNVQIKYFTERIGDVILAQENEALKGHTPAARLVLEAVGYLKKDDKDNKTSGLLAEAIKNISTILDK